MTSQLAERITRTLDEAGVGAPVPDAAFFEGVRVRTRRRRNQRRAAVAAAFAAAALFAGLIAGAPGSRLDNAPMPPTEAPPGPRLELTQPPLAGARPIEKVWPRAFHKLPLRMPDDREYVVIGSLDEDYYVVQPQPEPNVDDPQFGPPLAVKVSTGAFTPLAAGPTPAGFPTQGTLAVVGDTDVLWAAHSAWDDPHPWYEVWAIPRGGRPPYLLARHDGPEYLIAMREFDGMAYLELSGDRVPNGSGTSLATVPLSGGAITPIPNTDGFRLTEGGFAFYENRRVTSSSAEGAMGVTMLNLRTGGRIAYFFSADLDRVWCEPSWCRGYEPGTNDVVAVRLGGDEVALGEVGGGVRFVWDMPKEPFQSMYLWDVRTGKIGTAGGLAGYIDSWPDDFRTPDVLTWRSADGYLGVVDFGSIP